MRVLLVIGGLLSFVCKSRWPSFGRIARSQLRTPGVNLLTPAKLAAQPADRLPAMDRGEGLHHRRRQLRHRRLPGAGRARDPLRLLREGVADRRQLALRKRQRDVVRLPLAAHQQLAQADVLQGAADARALPGLPQPLPDGRLLRRLRRPLRAAGEDHLPHRGARRRAGRRGLGGDRRGRRAASARPSATGRCSSPTATTGTRAGPNPPSPAPTSSRASRSTSTTTASPTCCAASGSWCSGIGNSAVDIAVESSRIAEKTFLAMRRGAYVLPKFLGGKPIDEALARSDLAAAAGAALLRCAAAGDARPAT